MKKRTYGIQNWEYDYDSDTRQVTSIKDINDIESTFDYDDCQRLTALNERNGQLSTSFEYLYNLASGNGYNYIKSTNSAANLTSYAYFDGLGRPIENVNWQYSPDHRDVFTAQAYDSVGRPYRQFLPTEGGTSGDYFPPSGAFDEVTYESSPLGREIARSFAGGGSIAKAYGANGTDEVKMYDENGSQQGYYPANSLYVEEVTDENGHRTTTYTDKVGRMILVRRYLDNDWVDTYNIYDLRGNLVRVLPPGGTEYVYTYDLRNRVETKQIPGAGTQTFAYNDRDELISSTDANNNTLTYQYDDYGRQEWTKLNGDVVISNTYDTAPGASLGQLASTSVAVLDGSGNLNTSYVYDNLGRLLSTTGANHTGGTDIVSTEYEGATDRLTRTLRNHSGFENLSITQSFDFDHSKRLINSWHQIGSNPADLVQLSHSTYNFRDELIEKDLHRVRENVYLQSIDYRYNLRGWLTHINEPGLAANYTDACGDLPLQATEGCGNQEVTLAELLELRQQAEELNVGCYKPCEEEPLDSTLFVTGPDSSQLANQNNSLQTLASTMASTNAQSLTYPVELNRITLYEGKSRLVLAEELPIIEEEYYIHQCEQFASPTDSSEILYDGSIKDKPLTEILTIRQTTTPWLMKPDCEEEEVNLPCGPYSVQYSANSIDSTTLYSDYIGYPSAYPDLSQIDQPQNSLQVDNQWWDLAVYSYGEAAWDISRNVNADQGTIITALQVTVYISNATVSTEHGYQSGPSRRDKIPSGERRTIDH